MKKKIIYEIKSLYRDDFRVTGYEFGKGKKSVCIVGSIRGNEIQQLYTCSQLVKRLKKMEEEGKIKKGHKILVIPSVNPYSMNIKKRFWPTDNTDINRMFPGYELGETTQRIAEYHGHDGYVSMVVEDTDMVAVRTKVAGIFESAVEVGEEVTKGQVLANVIDPYEGEVTEQLKSPVDGMVFFAHDDPLTYANTAVYKLVTGTSFSD